MSKNLGELPTAHFLTFPTHRHQFEPNCLFSIHIYKAIHNPQLILIQGIRVGCGFFFHPCIFSAKKVGMINIVLHPCERLFCVFLQPSYKRYISTQKNTPHSPNLIQLAIAIQSGEVL